MLLTPLWAKANPDAYGVEFHDPLAADLLHRCGYDTDAVLTDRTNAKGALVRTQAIDAVASEFAARHPDAVILTAGIGLCTRQQRLTTRIPDGGAGLEWWRIDTADVIDVRRDLLPSEDTTLLSASVAGPRWADALPAGRPRLVIAEGLLMYLDDTRVATFLDQARTGSGAGTELVGDVMHPWPAKSGLHPIVKATGARFRSGARGAADLARRSAGWEWSPRSTS